MTAAHQRGRRLRDRAVAALAVAVAVAAFVQSPMASAEPVAATALVLRVVDGDTIDVRDDNHGRSTRARRPHSDVIQV